MKYNQLSTVQPADKRRDIRRTAAAAVKVSEHKTIVTTEIYKAAMTA